VSACGYRETLGSLLYPGSTHSLATLQPTVLLTERVLALKPHQRHHTIWRLDGGFGSDAAINWLLSRDYPLVVKGYNSRRAQKVGRALESNAWQQVRANQWVAAVPHGHRYARRTQTVALRWRTERGKEKYALLIHALVDCPLLQVVAAYDARAGMEAEIKQDKLGLGLVRRRKQHWGAQEAWILLTDVAHNLLTWTHRWMWGGSRFESYGHLRLVQDVLTIPGHLEFKGDKLQKVALHRSHPFATEMQSCLAHLVTQLC
jgi:Transposase DDE domain group 1